ncbi:MAG: LapA family protein [Betaproteobacteria bacterium]|nr:LapA family protein [Betaproteobacteria bacterium]MCC6249389.1 LapA family protein [Rubrivivax sp.]
MRLVVWLVRALLFFALFAFALNNQHAVTVHGFLGWRSSLPLVGVVLLAFAFGAALGVLAMLPTWWRARRAALPPAPAPADSKAQAPAGAPPAAHDSMAEYPPRVGL